MARYLYGGGGDGDIIKPTGVPYINATATVHDSRTGGQQVTDLQNISGASITQVTSDSFGQMAFWGPDNYIGVLWVDFGSGVRWALSPKAVDLAATRAITVQRAADAAATIATPKAALPYNTADPLEQALAQKLDPMVIPRFSSQAARDAAFPSPQSGDHIWRTDLDAAQVYNVQAGGWYTDPGTFTRVRTGVGIRLSNSVTEATLLSCPFPGNLPQGATFRIKTIGRIRAAASSAPTFTMRLHTGGITGQIYSTVILTAANTATPDYRAVNLEGTFTIYTTGTAGSAFGNLTVISSISSTGSPTNTAATVITDGHNTAALNTTQAQTLILTGQWSVAHADNIYDIYGWTIERVA